MDGLSRLLDAAAQSPPYPGLYHVVRAGTGEPEVLFTSADEAECLAVKAELDAARPEGDLTAYVLDVSWPGDRFVVELEIEDVSG